MDSNSPPGPSQSPGPVGQSGDVDRDGEIVDFAEHLLRRATEAKLADAAYRRLAAAVCDDEAAVDVDEHLARVLEVIGCKVVRP